MIHLPCSRIGVDLEADWDGCKQVYRAIKDAETKKKEEEDKQKRLTEDIRTGGEESGANVMAGTSTESRDTSMEIPIKSSSITVSARRGRRSTAVPNSSEGSSSTAHNYSGPVTRQRQRQSQTNAPTDSGT